MKMEQGTMHHGLLDTVIARLDPLNWPVAFGSGFVAFYFNELWQHLPAPTAVYTVITSIFMLFQMADKLGLLERFKRRKPNG
jgi:hypothetical protein